MATTFILVFVAGSWGPGARADGWSGGVSVANDKLYRGISQSRGRPSVLLDAAWRTDTGWHAGAGLATLAPGVEASVEAGRAWQLDAEWSAQIDAAYYAYRGSGQQRLYDYAELGARAGWRGRASISVTVAPSTEAYDPKRGLLRTGLVPTCELNVRQPLAGPVAIDAGLGYTDLSRVGIAGYRYGGIGVAWRADPVQGHLGYVRSDAARRGVVPAALAGGRWLAAVVWSF